MSKRQQDECVSKHMTLLQCLVQVERIENDMKALIEHESVAVPQVILKKLGYLSASMEKLLSEKERGNVKQ